MTGNSRIQEKKMKFVFDKDSMIKEISIAQEIITNKSPVSILSNILIIAENNSLTIKATDSTVKFTTVIPVDIQEEGRTTIFCDKFMSILSSLPSGEIEFIQEDIGVTIKPISKKVKFQLKSQASDKFPESGTSDNVPFFEIPSKDFKEMIKETIFAVSDDRNRYFMTGVYFIKNGDTLTMVATDGRRLSCDNKTGFSVPDFQPAIIPTKILSCILKNTRKNFCRNNCRLEIWNAQACFVIARKTTSISCNHCKCLTIFDEVNTSHEITVAVIRNCKDCFLNHLFEIFRRNLKEWNIITCTRLRELIACLTLKLELNLFSNRFNCYTNIFLNEFNFSRR